MKCKDETEELSEYLGVEITRDRRAKTITLRQTKYLKSLVSKYTHGDESVKTVATCMEGKLEDKQGAEVLPAGNDYRSYIGALQWAVQGHRLDVAFPLQ